MPYIISPDLDLSCNQPIAPTELVVMAALVGNVWKYVIQKIGNYTL